MALVQTLGVQAGQLVLVLGEAPGSPRAHLWAFERVAGEYQLRLGPVAATLGRRGFAPPGEKLEGDGRSPSGLFSLEFVFGYAPTQQTRMPYRQATEDDLWVDDPEAPDYNTWVRRGETGARSFELMKLPDLRYRHGIVVGYNRNPIVKGKGSAIFIHEWLKPGEATSGCVALAEPELVRLIQWLDPGRHPMVLMGLPEELLPESGRKHGRD